MNEADYTGHHAHAQDSAVVEIVAYERKDGSWDVFVFETAGSVPELEDHRTDADHIFIERVLSPDEIDVVARKIDLQLGTGYQPAPFYREKGTRRMIDRLTSHLSRNNAHKYQVRSCGEDEWELHIRRKDFELAKQLMAPNVDTESTQLPLCPPGDWGSTSP